MRRSAIALRRHGPRVAIWALAVVALACIVGGIALIFPPAGMIATGVALLAALTFDPTAVRKLTWPR